MVEARKQQAGTQNAFVTTEIAGQRPQYIQAVIQKQEAEAARKKAEDEKQRAKQAKIEEEEKKQAYSKLNKAIGYFINDLDEDSFIKDWKKHMVNATEADIIKICKEHLDTGFNQPRKAERISMMFTTLLNNGVLSWRTFSGELAEMTSLLPDIELDVPKARQFFFMIMSQLLTAKGDHTMSKE